MHLSNMARDFFGMNLVKMDVDHVTRVERNPPSFEYTLDEFEKEIIRGTNSNFTNKYIFNLSLYTFLWKRCFPHLLRHTAS